MHDSPQPQDGVGSRRSHVAHPRAAGVAPEPERRAFVTFLMFNDSYLAGCLMAAYGLVRQGSDSHRVCVVTSDISEKAKATLSILYDRVVEVENTPVPELRTDVTGAGPRTGSARVLGAALTRFACLRLGRDGDLGCDYDKVAMIDADLLPVRDFDQLWSLPAPAGIINERREHMAEIDERGRLIVRPESLRSGQWVWHDVYQSICPHGSPIPREITDRVATDHSNYGVNASLLLVEPSVQVYDDFMRWVARRDIRDLVATHWSWTDQQAATLYWSGCWTSVDPSFSTFYGYPSIDSARGLHFAGIKPWSWRKKGFERRLVRFADYRLWGEQFVEMLEHTPRLRDHVGLRRLEDRIRSVLHTPQ